MLVAHDGEVEIALVAADGRHVDLDRDHRRAGAERAGNGGKPILRNRADDGAGVRDLDRLHVRRQNGDDFGGAERQIDFAEGEQRVAEGGNARAFEARDGASASERDVAGREGDGDGGAGAEGGRIFDFRFSIFD